MIDNIQNKIITLGGKIYLNTTIQDIQQKKKHYNIKYTENDILVKVRAEKIVFAIPKKNLFEFKILHPVYSQLDFIGEKKLLRVYALYPKINGYVWFQDLPKMTTNNILRYIIPIDKSKGLIMISYSDSRFSEYWMQSNYNHTLENDIQHELSKCFPDKTIPSPTKLYIHYWENGSHYYKPSSDSESIYNSIIEPVSNIYICNEAYSMNQGWIEGSLEMSKKVTDAILQEKIKNTTVVKNNSPQTSTHISIEKVQKHNSLSDGWIVLYNKVYDITEWIPNHPGGSIIKQGLGKDATELWESIHGHMRKKDKIIDMISKYQIGTLV